jgi:hypothetical protein
MQSVKKVPFLLLVALILSVLSCQVLNRQTPQNQSETPAPAAQPPDNEEPDLSGAILKSEDLPQGFIQLTPEQMAALGYDINAMAQAAIQGKLSKASPLNTTVFLKQENETIEVIASTIIYPLTLAEQVTFDVAFLNPDLIAKPLLGNFASNVQSLPGPTDIGDKTAGFTFDMINSEPSQISSMEGELLFMRRNSAVALVMTVYTYGQTAMVNAVDVARILDGRLSAALGQ